MIILPAMIFCQDVTAQSIEGEGNPGKTEYVASYEAHLNHPEKALEAFDMLIKHPDEPSSIYNRACLYSLHGDKVHALADLKKAIELDPSIKEYARSDEDFSALTQDEEFINLTK